MNQPLLLHADDILSEERSAGFINSYKQKIGDPDAFYSSLYRFFLCRGVKGLIASQLTSLLSLGFTVVLSSLLVCFMDWKALIQECRSFSTAETSSVFACKPIFSYLISKSASSGKLFVGLLYPTLLSCYFIWRAFHAAVVVQQSLRMHRFYEQVLEISTEKLSVMTWSQVLVSLKRAQAHGRIQLPGKSATAIGEAGLEMDASLRLLRTSNYLIALSNAGMLDCGIHAAGVDLLLRAPKAVPGRVFLTSTLEWAVSFVVLEHMLSDAPSKGSALLDADVPGSTGADGDYLELADGYWEHTHRDEDRFHLPTSRHDTAPGEPRVSSAFLSDWQSLQWRFRAIGTVLLLLLPFTLAYSCLHFFLRNALPMRNAGAYLGPRRWSPAAQWMFREYNELPHDFTMRLGRASEPASKYLSSFPQPVLAAFARCVAYVSGALAACLVVLSAAAEGVLVNAHWADHNCFWWLAVFSSVYAAAISCAPDEDVLRLLPPRVELLASVAKETHYYFDTGSDQDSHPTDSEGSAVLQLHAHAEMGALFPHQALLFLAELMSTILTPISLLTSLSSESRVRRMLAFLRLHTRHVPGTGAVCALALFDFESYPTCSVAANAPSMLTPIPNGSARGAPANSTRGGAASARKMEASFLSFSRRNPEWRHGPLQEGGHILLERLEGMRVKEQEERTRHARQALSSLIGVEAVRNTQSPQQLPAVLQSVLAQQGLDWESDHYWLQRFRRAEGDRAQGVERVPSVQPSAQIDAKIAVELPSEMEAKAYVSEGSSFGLSDEDDDDAEDAAPGPGEIQARSLELTVRRAFKAKTSV